MAEITPTTTPFMSPSRTVDEIDIMARRKGRAHLCLRCYHKTGKEYIDQKYRVEAHVLRDHLRRDEVPFYCSLCQFRCVKKEELDDHLRRYKKHAVIANQAGVNPADPACLKANPTPLEIGPRDYLIKDKEESFNHWKTCIERRQATLEESSQDALATAMSEVFPEGITNFTDLGDFGQAAENTSQRRPFYNRPSAPLRY